MRCWGSRPAIWAYAQGRALKFSTKQTRTKLYGEIKEIHDEVERKFQKFKNFDILGHYPYDHHFVRSRSGRPRRIESEWEFIRARLPPEPKGLAVGSIFVRVYDQRIDLMSVMIVGRESAPYHQGLFFFDIFFPSNYLKLPQETQDVPSLFSHSFGFDLNPNLRKDGTVSIDKTQKSKNTMELLSSLKDLVVNDKTYIHYSQKGLKLNRKVFMQTFEAMLKMLEWPPRPFKDFVPGYFRTRAHGILLNFKARADIDEDNVMRTLFFKLVRAFEANGTYCGHHYNQKQYDQALKEEEELLNQSREKYGYGFKARDWLYFGV
ncbi:hypothetical protein ACLB2K_004546 [Fragaria x ananassa]